jgi:DNA-binding NtrC family response regulator
MEVIVEPLVSARRPVYAIRRSGRLTAEELIAAGCLAPVLITAPFPFTVRAIARRVHAASPRADAPLLHASVLAFPLDDARRQDLWAELLDRTAGGSLLLTELEETPAIVQEHLIAALDDLTAARRAGSPAVRIMGGTTAILSDRVAIGAFSDRLFYRLNVIRIAVDDAAII